jgi:SAM-dependent methyltransferase
VKGGISMTPTKAKRPRHLSRMEPLRWIPPEAASLLDVGCNVGDLLAEASRRYPAMRLCGIDVNPEAVAKARARLPSADLRVAEGESLPFADASFDCVTCIEVLEHLPEDKRVAAVREMRRVLRPGGLLLLRVPHAGAFAFLDSNNVRFRFPGLYRLLLGGGMRDRGYRDGAKGVVWHHHFTRKELLAVAGEGWEVERTCYGGLFLFPLMDWLSWPFYRLARHENVVLRTFHRVAWMDYSWDFGPASYGIFLQLRRR